MDERAEAGPRVCLGLVSAFALKRGKYVYMGIAMGNAMGGLGTLEIKSGSDSMR